MSATEIISEGRCLYCNEVFSKQTIHRHLQKHLKEKTKDNKLGKSFLIKVESNPKWEKDPYFLSLWVDSKTAMEDIDILLRKIWLECCGHLSDFSHPKQKNRQSIWDIFEAQQLLMKGKKAAYEKMMEDVNGEISMGRKAHAVLSKGIKIDYQYDYGSTTELQLAVVDELPIVADQPIVLLSRNEPLKIICHNCGKAPAIQMCTVCSGYDNSFFCKKCAAKHAKSCDDFADYAAMPVVNSPRMGVCGYDGGTIDKERDKPYSGK